MAAPGAVALNVELETWPLIEPFRITGHTTLELRVIVVTLRRDGYVGRGEAAGVFYRGENLNAIAKQVESVRAAVEAGIDRQGLRRLLPNGGARNAIDCALWDLEAKTSNCPAWQVAGLERPQALLTTFTCGADHPDRMVAAACKYENARALKLKLTGEPLDVERVRAVREARPDVWLAVDANRGFDRASLDRLMPVLVAARVALIEQPFPIGQEVLLDELKSPIPVAADESVQGMADLSRLVGRFNVINIKLDKCGGLTEALEMAHTARRLGFDVMIGNMLGTSLAMAPAFLVGQLCSVVDLDGPVFLKADRDVGASYADGFISCPDALWGSPF